MENDEWELVAAFPDQQTALELTRNRKERVRLLKVQYENGSAVGQEVIADVGATRNQS